MGFVRIVAAPVLALSVLSLATFRAEAQQCVNWSVYSCMDKPKKGAPAPAEHVVRLGVIIPKDQVDLDFRKLYEVKVTCGVAQHLPAPDRGIFNRTDRVTTHVVAITGKRLTSKELPTDAKVLIPVYSVSTSQANQWDFTNKACNQSFFVSGREPLFVSATANQTQTNSPNELSSLLYGGLRLFNPIWPLFAGATAVAAIQPVLNGISATEAPLKEMFAKFDSSGTETYSYPLYVGETNIRTPYSRTTVSVKEVPSIVQTQNGRYIVSFEDSLKGFWEEVSAPTLSDAMIATDCRKYARQLVAGSFPADDVIYALSYITRPSGLDTPKSVVCLGKEYGLRSVKLFTCPEPGAAPKCLWNRFKDGALTAADFTDAVPPQKYQAAFFKRLQNAMGDYAAAIEAGGERPAAELGSYFAEQVELEDFERLVVGKDGKITPEELMQQLVSSSFTKFGCQGADAQAAGMVFGFPPKAGPGKDDLYQSQDVVALRLWQGAPAKPEELGKVFKVEALFQPGLVEAAAKPTRMWCGKGVHLAATPSSGAEKPEKKEEANAGGE